MSHVCSSQSLGEILSWSVSITSPRPNPNPYTTQERKLRTSPLQCPNGNLRSGVACRSGRIICVLVSRFHRMLQPVSPPRPQSWEVRDAEDSQVICAGYCTWDNQFFALFLCDPLEIFSINCLKTATRRKL